MGCVFFLLFCSNILLDRFFIQATVTGGEEDAARDALEALNVVAAKQPELLLNDQGLDAVGKAMLSLAASPALEVWSLIQEVKVLSFVQNSAVSIMLFHI